MITLPWNPQPSHKHGLAIAAHTATHLELLGRLPIVTDAETQPRAFREILTPARMQGLTTCDAAYPEPAMRRGIALATRDKALVQAARHLGVETLSVEDRRGHGQADRYVVGCPRAFDRLPFSRHEHVRGGQSLRPRLRRVSHRTSPVATASRTS